MIETTGGDAVPADFIRYFGYNENVVSIEEEIFANFMRSVKSLSNRKDKVQISILGSASTVPTQTFENNKDLAQLRAENAKARILKYAAQFEIDTAKLEFISVEGRVQGPAYSGDAQSGADKYKKYQYIELNAK